MFLEKTKGKKRQRWHADSVIIIVHKLTGAKKTTIMMHIKGGVPRSETMGLRS